MATGTDEVSHFIDRYQEKKNRRLISCFTKFAQKYEKLSQQGQGACEVDLNDMSVYNNDGFLEQMELQEFAYTSSYSMPMKERLNFRKMQKTVGLMKRGKRSYAKLRKQKSMPCSKSKASRNKDNPRNLKRLTKKSYNEVDDGFISCSSDNDSSNETFQSQIEDFNKSSKQEGRKFCKEKVRKSYKEKLEKSDTVKKSYKKIACDSISYSSDKDSINDYLQSQIEKKATKSYKEINRDAYKGEFSENNDVVDCLDTCIKSKSRISTKADKFKNSETSCNIDNCEVVPVPFKDRISFKADKLKSLKTNHNIANRRELFKNNSKSCDGTIKETFESQLKKTNKSPKLPQLIECVTDPISGACIKSKKRKRSFTDELGSSNKNWDNVSNEFNCQSNFKVNSSASKQFEQRQLSANINSSIHPLNSPIVLRSDDKLLTFSSPKVHSPFTTRNSVYRNKAIEEDDLTSKKFNQQKLSAKINSPIVPLNSPMVSSKVVPVIKPVTKSPILKPGFGVKSSIWSEKKKKIRIIRKVKTEKSTESHLSAKFNSDSSSQESLNVNTKNIFGEDIHSNEQQIGIKIDSSITKEFSEESKSCGTSTTPKSILNCVTQKSRENHTASEDSPNIVETHIVDIKNQLDCSCRDQDKSECSTSAVTVTFRNSCNNGGSNNFLEKTGNYDIKGLSIPLEPLSIQILEHYHCHI